MLRWSGRKKVERCGGFLEKKLNVAVAHRKKKNLERCGGQEEKKTLKAAVVKQKNRGALKTHDKKTGVLKNTKTKKYIYTLDLAVVTKKKKPLNVAVV